MMLYDKKLQIQELLVLKFKVVLETRGSRIASAGVSNVAAGFGSISCCRNEPKQNSVASSS